MILSIPIFVEERSSGGARPPTFIARPLFFAEPVQRGEKLSRALAKLTNDLHEVLQNLGEEPCHDDLAGWAFSPLLDEATVELRLELASGSQRRNFFLAGYAALGRKLWFTPALPHLHFEVLPGQSLAMRAEEALTRHLRDLERDSFVDIDEYALVGKARLTVLELTLHPGALAKKAKKPTRAVIFGGEEKKDGERELRRTSRGLHLMYPDDLDRAIGREAEVAELARLLAASDRRPILLVGPRKVGKTTILHELVWQICARKKERFGGGRELWLVSPMRLISGMSYLGEWENRVLAILDYVRSKDRVLYFDDLPGLFTAGVSAASDLNVAQVLKPALEKRSVRVVAEITPEAWRVLRECDRAFADLFHVIPVHEPPEPETLRVLINVARQLEEEHRCVFDLEIVPTVYELHRRHGGDAAFPGKAAGFLRRLAVRFAGSRVMRELALQEFRETSGLQLALFDDRLPLERAQIVGQLHRTVVGQDHVLDAFADVLVALKARLNDPRRPLGTLLLLGPTGVGKTQSAKALAQFLFGSADRLLRFDMNEYVDAPGATRLTGTSRDPEGLLTSAIRRQPFSVVLFDEIEKAAPEVFDLLLAVLDEGRLTDALGRVADFTQAVIVLTSNLGVQEARSQPGFIRADPKTEDIIFVQAAEKFFRPEFFNRLDRIVPFRALDRKHLEGIARQLLAAVFARDGLQRRRGYLNITAAAMNRLVELGYHPQLGARALKRVVEREVAEPIAVKLAALPPGTPMIANLDETDGRFSLRLRELTPVARSVFWPEAVVRPRAVTAQSAWLTAVLDGVSAALERIDAELEAHAPTGAIELGSLPPEHARYFYCREQFKKVERLLHAVERRKGQPRRAPGVTKMPTAKAAKVVVRQYYTANPRVDRQREAVALQHNLDELETETVEVPDSPTIALLRELALLETLAAKPVDDRPALLVFRARLKDDSAAMWRFARGYIDCLAQVWGVSTTSLFPHQSEGELLLAGIFGEPLPRIQACYLEGMNLRRLLPDGAHTILAQRTDGAMGLILMSLLPASSESEARTLANELAGAVDTMDPDTFGPVIQMTTETQRLTDFRTGLAIPVTASAEEFRALILSALPLPLEVNDAIGIVG